MNYSLSAQIIFESDWNAAKQKAKREQRYIFVDAYTTWCGPCKAMAKNVFTDQAVGDFYNTNFICVKLDMEKEGTEFASEYSVQSYPTLMYFTPDLKIAKTVIGSLEIGGFLNAGRQALEGNGKLIALKNNFEKDSKNIEAAKKYTQELLKINDTQEASSVAHKYLSNIAEDQYLTTENMELVYIASIRKNKYVEYTYKNREKAVQLKLGETMLQQMILGMYMTDLKEAFETKEEVKQKIEKIKSKISKKYPLDAPAVNSRIDIMYAQSFEPDNIFRYLDIYMSKYCVNCNEITATVNNFLETPKDNATILQRLKVWSERAENFEKNTMNVLNTSKILKKLGYKQEALTKAEEAKTIAKNEQEVKKAEKIIKELK